MTTPFLYVDPELLLTQFELARDSLQNSIRIQEFYLMLKSNSSLSDYDSFEEHFENFKHLFNYYFLNNVNEAYNNFFLVSKAEAVNYVESKIIRFVTVKERMGSFFCDFYATHTQYLIEKNNLATTYSELFEVRNNVVVPKLDPSSFRYQELVTEFYDIQGKLIEYLVDMEVNANDFEKGCMLLNDNNLLTIDDLTHSQYMKRVLATGQFLILNPKYLIAN